MHKVSRQRSKLIITYNKIFSDKETFRYETTTTSTKL